jgi:HEAT repeat protein
MTLETRRTSRAVRGLVPTLAFVLASASADAQDRTLARRIAAAPADEHVRLAYATRDGTCGDGRSLVAIGRMFHGSNWEGWGHMTGVRCLPGLARVTLVRRDGRVTEVRGTIGGQWSADAGGTALGQVPAAEAAAYLLSLAESGEERAPRGALWAAAIADSAPLARRFLSFALNEDRAWKDRRTALQLAGATGDAAMATELERLARSASTGATGDPTADARRRKKDEGNVAKAAAEALAMVPDGAGLDGLVRLASDAPSEAVRRAAVFHAAQSGEPRAVRVARAVAEDERQPEAVRNSAIFGLLNSDETGADERAWARALFPRLTSDKLRDPILMGLAQHGGDADRRWVLSLAANGDLPLKTRRSAVFWAGQGGTPIAELLATYRDVGDREVKEHVIFALSQRQEEAATDALVDIARKDGDRELRKKALFWLGQRKDEKATKVLTDLIINQ